MKKLSISMQLLFLLVVLTSKNLQAKTCEQTILDSQQIYSSKVTEVLQQFDPYKMFLLKKDIIEINKQPNKKIKAIAQKHFQQQLAQVEEALYSGAYSRWVYPKIKNTKPNEIQDLQFPTAFAKDHSERMQRIQQWITNNYLAQKEKGLAVDEAFFEALKEFHKLSFQPFQ